ncbi:MAG TPA: nucleotide exchange factor GrpE [Candidatus Alectryocaccobium stercorigallinarum]|nr:nucleotide exchange factor GrpE [Candidatus Alectryocaccobium stercorigallinarum]
MPNSEENKNVEEVIQEESENASDAAADETVTEAEKAADTQEAGANEAENTGGGEAENLDEAADGDGTGNENNDGEAEKSTEKNKEDKKERKFFKKKEKKDKKDEKIEELTDRLTRQMAEFDNYRKRTEKEKAANYVVGAKDVIEKLLPVVDNFERGLAGADLSDPFVDGMNKIYKQLMTLLADLGVTPIEAVGKEFDPNFHNAVMHIDDEELGENIIAEEFQKGYMYKDHVVRHSMVKVAN